MELSQVSIDQGHMLSDVLFDGMFADMKQHERIRQSEAQMQRAMDQLQRTIGEQHQRVSGAQGHVQDAAYQLEEARKQLQNTRSEAFRQLAGQQA